MNYIDALKLKSIFLYFLLVLVGCGSGEETNNEPTVDNAIIKSGMDSSFGTDGKVLTSLGLDNYSVTVGIDSADKIIVGGQVTIAPLPGETLEQSNDYGLIRLNADGTLDNTFGVEGIVINDFGGLERARSIFIDDSQRIVLGGDSIVDKSDISIARFNSDGSLDTSFDGDGYVLTDFNDSADPAMDITPGLNGKIVTAGFSSVTSGVYDFSVARYNSDGSLDTSFSSDGWQVTDLGNIDNASGIAVTSTGKVVAVGRTGTNSVSDIAIVQYNEDGSIDSSFSEDGIVILDLGGTDDRLRQVVVGKDDKPIVVGRSNVSGKNSLVLMKYNVDGSLDTSFSEDGIVIHSIAGINIQGYGVVLDKKSRIVIVGHTNLEGDNDFVVLRYNNNGTLDTTFANDGIQLVDFGGNDKGIGISLDSKDRIVVVGKSDIEGVKDFAVARLIP